MVICEKNDCTGCGACVNICPHSCISLCEDRLGALYPEIDSQRCVECNLCVKICPSNREPNYKTPRRAYAAWSRSVPDRQNSASGGVAAKIYEYAIEQGWYSVGVKFDVELGAYFIPINTKADVELVRNSKYTYSNAGDIYYQIKKQLDAGRQVLFIALPCQVAALYSFLRRPYSNLLTVDIICHGVAPTKYIKQHIESIELQKSRKTQMVSFRDPEFKTNKFVFSLRDINGCFYKAKAQSCDLYQIGYHKALIYRENCYKCKYACSQRVADITIGDFSGLGRVASVDFSGENVSCVLINSDSGTKFFETLSDKIEAFERPLAEALNYEKQLQSPSVPHPQRDRFVKRYIELQDFDKAIHPLLKQDKINLFKEKISPTRAFKRLVVLVTPKRLRKRLKALINRDGITK